MKHTNKHDPYVLWFEELANTDVPLVGGKNASLGEMYRNLRSSGVRVPNGFAVTAHAYRTFIDYNNLEQKIKDALKGLDTKNTKNLAERGKKVRNVV